MPQRVRLVLAVVLSLSLSTLFAPVHPGSIAFAAGTAPRFPSPRLLEFQSPSTNIHCNIVKVRGGNSARCDIDEHSFTSPPKPATCHFDWGSFVKVRKRAYWACVSDPATGSPDVPILHYGHSRTVGHVRCTSRRSGMTCTNLKTRHGFKLSRAAVTFF